LNTKDNIIYLLPNEGLNEKTLIWLHGYGETPSDYLNLFLSDRNPLPLDIKIVLPSAPKLLMNNNLTINSWYEYHTDSMQKKKPMENDRSRLNTSEKFLL